MIGIAGVDSDLERRQVVSEFPWCCCIGNDLVTGLTPVKGIGMEGQDIDIVHGGATDPGRPLGD